MINRLIMPVYASRVVFKGSKKAGEHPMTDKILGIVESKEVEDVIKLIIRKGTPWSKIYEKTGELNITPFTPKDKQGLRQFIDDAQGEWQVDKKDGTHKALVDYFKCRLRDS